jgi:hypothetical protein
MSNRKTVFVGFIALLAVIISGALLNSAVKAHNQELGYHWGPDHYEEALDAAMPLKGDDSGDGVNFVGYRVMHTNDNDFLEFSFVLLPASQQNALEARIRTADGVSILHQLDALHTANKNEALASLERELKIKTWTLKDSECAALQVQYAKYEKLTFGPPSAYVHRKNDLRVYALDAFDYEFRIRGFKSEWNLDIHNADDPLVVWATETRRDLESCISTKERHSSPH